jgi:nitrile hydratase subunit beta
VNGVHDIGGIDGFGPIHREPDEPVFHDEWEGRVFGMSMLGAGLPPITLDARRHQLERLPPVEYLSFSYYERWLARVEQALVETGTLAREEIDKRIQEIVTQPDSPMPRCEDPERADGIASTLRAGRPAARKIRQKPRFAIGDKIVTRNLNPHGHTRLPRYARGKRGVIVAHHGAHVFPDSNAHGLGENPQHLYTVRITSRELWGADAEPAGSVQIDLWESYLDQDKAAAKSSPKSGSAAKRMEPMKLTRLPKARARLAPIKHSPRASLSPSKPGKPPSLRKIRRARQSSRKPTRRSR